MSCSNKPVNDNEECDLAIIPDEKPIPDDSVVLHCEPPKTDEIPSMKKLRRNIITFAWPCVAELFLVSLIAMVSLIMVGHLGPYAITAVGITNQPVFISIAVFQAFNIGATALVARFIGAKDYNNAKLVVIQALIVSVISAFILSSIGFIFSRGIVVSMGAQEDTVDYATLYMQYMSIGIIFQAIPSAVSSLLRGAGDTKSPMRFNIASNLINVVLGYLLIYGFWVIPGMGVKGAAIASTISKAAACVMSIHIIYTSKLPIAISLKDKFQLDFSMLKRIMNIGYAAAGEQFVLRVGMLFFVKMIADLGTIAFASHQIGISVISLSFNFGQALGMAATSMMGRSLGAKKPDLAETYGKEIRRMGMAVSACLLIIFFFLGKPIAMLYTSDIAVITNVAMILKVVALNMPLQTSQLIISGGLRGAGDTRWPFIATMAGVLGVRLIFGFIFIKILLWGVLGAWLAMTIDQFVRSAVIFFRFKTGKWKYIKV